MQWTVGHHRLLERVASDCHLATACGAVAVRRFFNDSYSRCLNGNIFDGAACIWTSCPLPMTCMTSSASAPASSSCAVAVLVESDRRRGILQAPIARTHASC
jgi:hypothetical protein